MKLGFAAFALRTLRIFLTIVQCDGKAVFQEIYKTQHDQADATKLAWPSLATPDTKSLTTSFFNFIVTTIVVTIKKREKGVGHVGF
jgi:hypothetical protein